MSNQRTAVTVPIMVFCLLFACASRSMALTVKGNFVGGHPNGPVFGGGNLPDIFEAAARYWERIIKDDFTVTFDYGWGATGGGTHLLLAQGGTPNRETYGLILVNNRVSGGGPGLFPLYIDPKPKTYSEFPFTTETSTDLGRGPVNIVRLASTPGFDYDDLFTMVLHEIGHGLGLSLGNTSFVDEAADGNVGILDPLPFSGSVVPLVGSHLDLPQGNLMGGNGLPFNSRVFPSEIDILVIAQLSQFQRVSIDKVKGF